MMKKYGIIGLLAVLIVATAFVAKKKSSLYIAKSTYIKFFSEAPLEDIKAENKKSKSLLNVSTKEIAVVVPIVEFQFEKSLMQEHFNENYMESSKYPTGSFKGEINEDIDFSKDGKYDATATGTLKIHGVEQERTIEGTVEVEGKTIIVDTKFNVALEDHKIKIPRAVTENIAEVIEVTARFEYEPKK